jgi:membrane-associated protein
MLLPSWMDPEYLINLFGPYALWGVAFIVFAECGLFAILPGDSLLFTVGVFVAIGAIDHSLVFVCLVLTIAAVAGNVSGYWIGRLIGPPLFHPRTGLRGRILNPKYVTKTHVFFERYGNRALILARFVPIVRTFAPIVAGVGRMEYRTFVTYNVAGGILWGVGITTLGFLLGEAVDIDKYLLPVVAVIVVISVIPVLLELRKAKREGAERTPVEEARPAER